MNLPLTLPSIINKVFMQFVLICVQFRVAFNFATSFSSYSC